VACWEVAVDQITVAATFQVRCAETTHILSVSLHRHMEPPRLFISSHHVGHKCRPFWSLSLTKALRTLARPSWSPWAMCKAAHPPSAGRCGSGKRLAILVPFFEGRRELCFLSHPISPFLSRLCEATVVLFPSPRSVGVTPIFWPVLRWAVR